MRRQKMRQIWILGLLMWTVGCGVPAAPIDLIQPPLPASHSHEAVVRRALPDGSRLLIPKRGGGNTGISYGDVDGDGHDEAVIVYEENVRNEKTRKAALLRYENKQWNIVWDTKGYGYGLDYAGLTDVNKDGLPEIVLGWTMGGDENGLDVYTWKNQALKLWDKKTYSGQIDFDVNADEKSRNHIRNRE
ncbi:hypothetical protein [Paenibacillus alvei]|uniref:VCBS repeat-containing protein n=1 Tax=Paenibacillus alvei TaxID=44250 RepID=A0AAP7DLF0_PAEAL|nr:hypothetical protein [Paenibacillus alvei]NOJ73659.1 hypothetical protein [Paenibacillus alvei]